MTSALFALIAFAQAEPEITLDLPISSLRDIVQQVSLQSRVEHQVIGPEPNHWLFVQVKDMPASRLRDAIAKATGGKWMKSGDAWALQTVQIQSSQDQAFSRSMTAWKASQREAHKFDIASYEVAMKKASDLSKAGESYDYREMNKLQEGAPDRRFALKLVQLLPLPELISLSANEPRVYSLQPTSLQRQLPAQAATAFSEFLHEASVVSSRVDAIVPESEDGQYYNFLAAPYRSSYRLAEANKFLLILSRESFSSELAQAEVLYFDRTGRRIFNTSITLNDSGTRAFSSKVEGTKVFEGLNEKLKLSPEEEAFAKDLIGALGGLQPGQKREPIRESTRQRLLNMDKVDPLTFGATDVMRAFASAKKKQVVARINDLAMLSLAFALQSPQGFAGTPLAAAAMVATGSVGAQNPDILDADDLIVFPVVTSSEMPNLKMPRRATAELLRAANQNRDLIDPLSSVAAISNGYEELMLPAMLTALFGSSQAIQPEQSAFDALKFYGLLSAGQKKMVRQGGLELGIDGLPPQLLSQARQMLLGRKGSFTPLTPEMKEAAAKDQNAMDQIEEMASNSFSSPENYDLIPSVFLAGPNAKGGTVRVRMTSRTVVLQSRRYGSMVEASPTQVAWSIRNQEENPSASSEPDRYAQGSLTKLITTFSFGSAGIRSFIMTLPVLAPGVELKELKNMPAEFQAEVRKALDEIRRYPVHRGDGGGALKPP